jgi:hypothetical protein
MDFSIPFSWYLINDNFNTIQFVDGNNVSTTIVVPKGSYNYFDLCKTISLLYPSMPVLYKPIQNQVFFASATNQKITFSAGIAEILGFQPNFQYSGDVISSVMVCTPMAITHIILGITNLPPCDANVNLTNLTGDIAPSYQIATVPITHVSPFHEITWENILDFGMFTSDNKLTNFDFEVMSEDGNEITFIPDHRFTLRIDVYDIEEYDDMHRAVDEINQTVKNLFLHKYLK